MRNDYSSSGLILNKTGHIDDLDRRIVGALLANPRATNLQVSQAVRTSEPTVSRRMSRLLSSGLVRVTAVLDSEATKRHRSVFVRLRCRPGEAHRSAARLAEWPECGSVKLLSGSVDCVAEIWYTSKSHLLSLIMDRLPALDGVLAVWSNQVIRRFSTPHSWMPPLIDDDAIEKLRAQRIDWWYEQEVSEGSVRLTELDERIAAALGDDGRLGWHQLAASCDASPTTARRHAEDLMASGALRLRTVVEPETVGFGVDAFVSLTANPTQLERLGEELAAHPAVLMIAATTGDRNLCGEIALESDAALYTFISTAVGSLPGLQHADVALTLRSMKRAGFPAPQDTAEHQTRTAT